MATDPTTAFVWSFLPNWSSPFRVAREYRTTVWQSRSAREQRRALRQTPRRTFNFNAVFTGTTRREFRGLMAKAQNKPIVMPDWSRRTTLAANAAETAISFTVTAVPGWLVGGRAIFLFDGKNRPTVAYVSTVVGTTVTITSPLTSAWVAGSDVLPGPVGFIAAETRIGAATDSVTTSSLQFAVEATSEPAESPAAASTTFNGREVCLLPVNWRDGLDITLAWAAEQVDFGHGATEYSFPVDFQSGTRRALFTAGSRAEAAVLDDFFDRMKGQRGEFYLPSGEDDMTPAAALTSGTATLTVEGTDTALDYDGSTVHGAICVTLNDGTNLYRTVTDIVTNSGNSVLTLGSNWTTTIPVASVARISWMPVCRFASDTLVVEWVTDSVAEADLAMRFLEHLVAE